MFLRFIAALIHMVTGIIETLLGVRFLLRFLAANPSTPFVHWVYDTSEPLLQPFAGMFRSPVVEGQLVIEFNTLFAMILYAVIGYFLVDVLLMGGWLGRERRIYRDFSDPRGDLS